MRVRIVGMSKFLARFRLARLSDRDAHKHRADIYKAELGERTNLLALDRKIVQEQADEIDKLHSMLEAKTASLNNMAYECSALTATQSQLVDKIALHEATIENVSSMYRQCWDNAQLYIATMAEQSEKIAALQIRFNAALEDNEALKLKYYGAILRDPRTGKLKASSKSAR